MSPLPSGDASPKTGARDMAHYQSERRREAHEVENLAERERREVAEIFRGYGLVGGQLDSVVSAIAADPERWVDFMMRHELGLERPDPKRAPVSALTIGGSYLLGGLVPLAACFFLADAQGALIASVAMTGIALLCIGAVKARPDVRTDVARSSRDLAGRWAGGKGGLRRRQVHQLAA